MEKNNQIILKDKDKKALNLFKFSKVQKIKNKTNRCVQMTSSLLSNIISDDDNENKTDISVAKIVCSVIEFLFTNTKKYKINKLEIALTVYEQLFGNLTEEQKKTIIKNIEHIVEHKLIQKISKLELAKNDIAGFLKFILF
jgi:hypothetical protein